MSRATHTWAGGTSPQFAMCGLDLYGPGRHSVTISWDDVDCHRCLTAWADELEAEAERLRQRALERRQGVSA